MARIDRLARWGLVACVGTAAAGPRAFADPPSQRLPIEHLMREVRARADPCHVAAGPSYPWPNPCGGGPTPHYPPDGYYGDAAADPSVAASLISAISAQLPAAAQGYITVESANLEGVDVGDCTPDFEYYTSVGFPNSVPSTINAENYLEAFAAIQANVALLRFRVHDLCGGTLSAETLQYGYGVVHDSHWCSEWTSPPHACASVPCVYDTCDEMVAVYATNSQAAWCNAGWPGSATNGWISPQGVGVKFFASDASPEPVGGFEIRLDRGIVEWTNTTQSTVHVYVGTALYGLPIAATAPGPYLGSLVINKYTRVAIVAPGTSAQEPMIPSGTPSNVPSFISSAECGHAFAEGFQVVCRVLIYEIEHFNTSASDSSACEDGTNLPDDPNDPTTAPRSEGNAGGGGSERGGVGGGAGGSAGTEGDGPDTGKTEGTTEDDEVEEGEPCDSHGANPAGPYPVEVATGHKVESATDLVVPVTGVDFRLTRTYSSQSDLGGSDLLGNNWTCGLFAFLSIELGGPDPTLTLYGAHQRSAYVFTYNEARERWEAGGPATQFIELSTLDMGAAGSVEIWRLVTPGEGHVDFFADDSSSSLDDGLVGQMVDERDVWGNGIRYEYTKFGTAMRPRLMRAYINGLAGSQTDPPEAYVVFAWGLNEASTQDLGKLLSATAYRTANGGQAQFLGSVHYTYMKEGVYSSDLGKDGDLILVSTATLVDAAEAGEPLRLRYTQYRYHGGTSASGGSTDDPWRDNISGAARQLKLIIEPEQIEYYAQYGGVTGDPEVRLSNAADSLLYLGDATFFTDSYNGLSVTRRVFDLASKIVDYTELADGYRVEREFVQSSCGCGGASSQGLLAEYEYITVTTPDPDHQTMVMTEWLFTDSGTTGFEDLHRVVYMDTVPRTGTTIPYLRHSVVEEPAGRVWATLYDYDETGNLVKVAQPSARDGDYEPATTTDPAVLEISTTSGVVHAYAYNADNRLTEVRIGEGDQGDTENFTLLHRTTYPTTNSTHARTYLRSMLESFAVAGTTDQAEIHTTTFEYGFHSGDAVAWIHTEIEAELPAENGPSSGTYGEYLLLDEHGRARWSRDAVSALNYREFDDSGRVVLQVRNADPAGSSDNPQLSGWGGSLSTSGWGAFADGGSLATVLTRDAWGRLVDANSPGGVHQYWRRELRECASRPGMLYLATVALPHQNDPVINGSDFGGPAIIRWENARGEEVAASVYEVDGLETYAPLSGEYTLEATTSGWGTLGLQTTGHLLSGLIDRKVSWHEVDESWAGSYVTTYSYDRLGRLTTIVDPTEGVTELDYDVMGRTVAVRVGTTSSSPVTVGESFYDNTSFMGSGSPAQGMGDGNLTVVRRHTGDNGTLEGAYRDTITIFDARNRPVVTRNETAPHTAVLYDNLDRPIQRAVYDGVPTAPAVGASSLSSTNRRMLTTTSYGQRGVPFRTRVAIDPTQSSPTWLESHVWRDPVGRAIAEWSPTGPGVKRTYDALGRVVAEYTTDRGGDTASGSGSLAHADDLTGDKVLEQAVYRYDAAGSVDLVTTTSRLHDTSATGALTTSSGVLSYVGYYYDDAQRRIRTVNFGTNISPSTNIYANGSAPTWPPSEVPEWDDEDFDDFIVDAVAFNTRGLVDTVTDPEGKQTRSFYDDLNRRIAVSENYVNASISWNSTPDPDRWAATGVGSGTAGDDDRVTSFVYDANGNVVQRIAHLPGGDQVTLYSYGTTAGSATVTTDSLIASQHLLKTIRYPDEGTLGQPGSGPSYTVTYAYNRVGEVRAVTDQNETTHVYTRDDLGRITADQASFGSGSPIDQTIDKIGIEFDDVGRVHRVVSYDTGGPTTMNAVEMEYSSLWQLTKLWQDPDSDITSSMGSPTGTTKLVQYAYDTQAVASGNYTRPSTMTYPDGTVVDYVYGATDSLDDVISRVSALNADGFGMADELVEYAYVGLSMAAVVDYPTPDILLDRTYDAATGKRRSQGLTQSTSGEYHGWDRFGRVQRQAWFDGAMASAGSPALSTIPSIFEEFYTYDRVSNRTGRYDERPGAITRNSDARFLHDGLDRLKTEEIGRAAGGFGGGWTPGPLSRQWDLDLLGNWQELRYDVSDGFGGDPNGIFGEIDDDEETRTHNYANEITARTPNGTGTLDFTNDHAGNTRDVLDTSDDGTRYTHDAWNRLVRVQTVDGGSSFADVASYQYNGLHWRTLRDNGVDERDLFYYSSDWQLIEERRHAYSGGNPLPGTLTRIAQQFWGLRYIDDAVARRVDANADGDYVDDVSGDPPVEGEGAWFYLTDAQFSVVAVMTDAAVLAERVRYDAYGRARHRWYSDLDGDGDSDVGDYNVLYNALTYNIDDPEYVPDADLDRDGDVDNTDFFALLPGLGWSALDEGLISDPLGPDNPIGYDGYVFAPEAGLNVPAGSPQKQALGAYCVRFRWYVPETGRWLQRDPAGYIDGASLFQYVGSRVLRFLDSMGLEPEPTIVGGLYSGIAHHLRGTAVDRATGGLLSGAAFTWSGVVDVAYDMVESTAESSIAAIQDPLGTSVKQAEALVDAVASPIRQAIAQEQVSADLQGYEFNNWNVPWRVAKNALGIQSMVDGMSGFDAATGQMIDDPFQRGSLVSLGFGQYVGCWGGGLSATQRLSAAGVGASGYSSLPTSSARLLEADDILFSQSNVRSTLFDRVREFSRGAPHDPIDVVRFPNGTLVTIDNTRLAAAKLSGRPILANVRGFGEALPTSRDPTGGIFNGARTWGDAAMHRISRQNPLWRQKYPTGSPFTSIHPSQTGVLQWP